jgi:hypothetical protein
LTAINNAYGPLSCLKFGLSSNDAETKKRTVRILRKFIRKSIPEIRFLPYEKERVELLARCYRSEVVMKRRGMKLPPLKGDALEREATKCLLDLFSNNPLSYPVGSSSRLLEAMYEEKLKAIQKELLEEQ